MAYSISPINTAGLGAEHCIGGHLAV